tara:strand:+ start:416 stop:940 length:525 start_codon:yes stop_codon:yes gene_type:complete
MSKGLSDLNKTIFLRTYKLLNAGNKKREILRTLEKEFKERKPSERTLGDWLKRIREIPDSKRSLDEQIEWHELGNRSNSEIAAGSETVLGWELGRAFWWYKKCFQECPSIRYLIWWGRLNEIGEWADSDLHEWTLRYEEGELYKLFGILAPGDRCNFKDLDEKMFANRKDLKMQ